MNLGAVCRAMANTGFTDLCFTGRLTGMESAASRFAVHAGYILQAARKKQDLADLLADSDVVFGFTPRNPWEDGKNLDLDGFHKKVAEAESRGQSIGLLFGNEKVGLHNEHLVLCNWRVALPTAKTYISMNLAQAVLVVLWEMHRRRAG